MTRLQAAGIAFLRCLVGFVIVMGTLKAVTSVPALHRLVDTPYRDVVLAGLAPIALIAYALHVRLVDRRPCLELAPGRLAADLAGGVGIALVVIGLTVAIAALAGDFHLVAWQGFGWGVAMTACSALFAGMVEEIVMRGLLFRFLEIAAGRWIALLVTSSLFGLIHLANPDAGVMAAIGTGAMGMLLGAGYLATRRLWLPIALHAGWNFALAGLAGSHNSGTIQDGLLVTAIDGSRWLTGGAFGFEASLETIALALLCAGGLLTRAKPAD
jgi:membrane protease YdiL (CAAX protease family)